MKIDLEEVAKSKYTVEEALVLVELECKRRGLSFPYSSSTPLQYINLVKKGVLKVNESGYKISTTGFQEFRKIIGMQPLKLKNKATEADFEKFWEAFPISNAHGAWKRTRLLRNHRIKSKEKYYDAVNNGTSPDDILKALAWEIKERKETSGKDNKMSYMKNSATWLNQEEFAINLEAMKEEDNTTSNSWTEIIT